MKREKSFTKQKFSVYNLLLTLLLIFYAITIIFSIYFVLSNAFKDFADYAGGHSVTGQVFEGRNIFGIPRLGSFTFYNIKEVLGYEIEVSRSGESLILSIIPDVLLYSVVYAIGGSFVAALVPCITAYFVAKFNYKFSKVLYAIVIVVMIVPIVGNLPSTYRVLKFFNIYDNMIGLVILCKGNFVNMWFLVFFAAFKSVPNDYMEAAYIDGASEFRVMTTVMLPLVRNTFLTVVLIFFVDFWNDYQTPALFLPSYPTLSYVISTFTSISVKTSDDLYALKAMPFQMAACAILIIPTLLLFVIFRDKLMGNLTMGGIKG